MPFMMWAAYRQAANKSVPAPWDADTPNAPVWYDHVAKQAPRWAAMGIDSVLLPPVLKTNAGHFIGADGYGVYDDYDVGSKSQFYSYETRFGNAQQLLRCIACCHAAGLDVYVDMVPHQRMGGNNGVYTYHGADGRTKNGRFPKQPSYFRGNASDGRVPEDPVPVPADDFSFGDELCPINAKPPGAVMEGLLEAGDWLFRRLGVDGARLDDTKGMAVEFVNKWCNYGAMAGKFIVGEYADGNPNNLNGWVWGGTHGRCSAFDFSVHYPVQSMCNNNSNWNMEQLGNSLADMSSMNSVTFVESPDTDTNGFATVIWNKAQGYHWIACRTGKPALYYKDWSDDATCYGAGGLQPHIENSVWIQAKLAHGAQVCRYSSYQVYAIERTGQPGLLCAINNDQYNAHVITVQTAFGPSCSLHDYSGHMPDVWTDGLGRVTLTVPKNVNGLGTVAYSRQGQGGAITVHPKRTKQTFFGADDLDIGPAINGSFPVGQVWAREETQFSCKLTVDQQWIAPGGKVTYAVTGPNGAALKFDANGYADTKASGWHTVSVVGAGLDASVPFDLEVTYMGAPL